MRNDGACVFKDTELPGKKNPEIVLEPTFENRPTHRALTVAIVVSLGLHAIFMAGLAGYQRRSQTTLLSGLECPMSCEDKPDADDDVTDGIILTILPPESEEEPPQPPPEDEDEDEDEDEENAERERESLPENAYLIDLERENQEVPLEDTEYLAPEDNRTEEEVVAEETTLLETPNEAQLAAAAPSTDPLPETQEPEPDDEESAETPERSTRPDPEEAEVAAIAPEPEETQSPGPPELDPSPRALEFEGAGPEHPEETGTGALDWTAFRPSQQSYQELFGDTDQQEYERIQRQLDYQGYLGGDHQEAWEQTLAAMDNMVPEARFGTETRLNARRSEYAEYISYVHRLIHGLWGEGYLINLDLRHGPGHPLANPNLEAQVELVLDRAGALVSMTLIRTSGELMYDSEAIGVIQRITPLRAPPDAIISPNGNVYIHWTFWRDTRQCGTFGASIHWVE